MRERMAESSANYPTPSHAVNKLPCPPTEKGHESGDNAGTKEAIGAIQDEGNSEKMRGNDEGFGNAKRGTRRYVAV